MEFKWMVILLLEITFICVTFGVVEPLKSIWSKDGDIIDCIDIYKQPAFDHPALKNHKIQMTPSYDKTMEETTTTKAKASITVTSQLWQKNGRCPNGTIPIRRIRKYDVFQENQIHSYGRKKPSHHHVMHTNETDQNLLLANHSLVILLTEGYSYSGAKGDIKVLSPYVEPHDYTTSRVSLKNGPSYHYEAVETGWAVNPSVYGDNQTRLYVYWTVDSSKTTGCFDVTCPGFVQTNSEIALGAAIYPISNPTGLPYQITVYIYKDPNTSNWWVQYGEKINIGYWPAELFSLLRYQAITVQWGGEVYSSKVGTHPHTKTGMGSGEFADYISGNSGVVKRMRIEENSHELKLPEWTYPYSDEYDCYDYFHLVDYVEEPEFYYGGPGSMRNPMCP